MLLPPPEQPHPAPDRQLSGEWWGLEVGSVCLISNLAMISTSCNLNSHILRLQFMQEWFAVWHFINRNWEVLLLCFVCALLVLSGHLFLLASTDLTPYPLLNNSISLSAYLRQHVAPIGVVSTIGVVISNFLPLPPRRRRLLIDLAFALIMLRTLLLFGILNLMIFLPPSDRVLLFSQLLLFLPCFLLVWGWIYWRVDTHSVSLGRGRIFTSSTSEDDIPPSYDYFIASFTSLLTTTLDNFNGKTRFARTLIFVHGVMMWDIMALTLSRAIALASA